MRQHIGSTVVRLGALALLPGLLLTGCGDQEETGAADDPTTATPTDEPTDSTPTDEPRAERREPTCASVWVDGETLPERYRGCFDEDKEAWVRAEIYRCGSGQQLVTYKRNFYAAKGEVVNETSTALAKDPDFKKAMAACGA